MDHAGLEDRCQSGSGRSATRGVWLVSSDGRIVDLGHSAVNRDPRIPRRQGELAPRSIRGHGGTVQSRPAQVDSLGSRD